MVKGKIAKIESMGMLDGPGIRTIVFTQGCILRCAYCHNPSLLTLEGGTEYTPQELLEKVKRFKIYYKNGGGVTVSGGEPLIQTTFLTEFFKLCKENQIHTCLDTSGVGYGDFSELLKYTDLVLLDIKHTREKEFKELTLVNKERTKPFIEELNKSGVKVWIRQVIMPNYNDNQEYLQELLQEILPIKNVEKVEFLPFHTMAEHIYYDIGIPYRLKGMPAMDSKKCKELEDKFIELYKPYNNNLIVNEYVT